MFLINWFQESVLSNTLMILFLVAFIGYLVGSITIKGVELGTAGVLLVALVFGHFIGNNERTDRRSWYVPGSWPDLFCDLGRIYCRAEVLPKL